MKKLCMTMIGCAAVLMANAAQAEEVPNRVLIAATGGTLGVGPEVSYRVMNHLGVRANATFLNAYHQVDSGNVGYKGALDLGSYGAMADFYPFAGSFRLSAGARINKNKVKLSATPSGYADVGNSTYAPAQIGTLSGTVTTDNFAPVATIGWGGGLRKGIKLGFDVGVMAQGAPKVMDLAVSSTSVGRVSNSDLIIEQNKINDKLNKYKLYPVVQISLGFAF